MKVAILGSKGVPARYGAFEECAERLGLGLARRGWDVTIWCPHSHEYRESTYKGLVLRRAYLGPGVVGNVLYDVTSLLLASFDDSDVVLMLGHSSSPFCFIPRMFGQKVVINTDGLEWRRSKWPGYVRAWLRMTERVATWTANALVSDSEAIQAYYRRRYRAASHFIPYGAEIPAEVSGTDAPVLLKRWGVSPQGYYVVVARMEPENSIREVVEGFLSARTARRLILVGPTTPFFECHVRPLLDGEDRVRYLGPIYKKEDLVFLRRHAFAYIHGHTVGGTNPVLLEAMAIGNSIIARGVPFNREVLKESGIFFTTPGHLSQVIAEVEAWKPDEHRRRARQNLGRVKSLYNWERVTRVYEELFHSLVRRGR